MFKKGELGALWRFYLSAIFVGLFGFASIYWTVYLSQRFSFTTIATSFAITATLLFLLEVPTGALADVFGRKSSIMLAHVLLALCFFSFPYLSLPWHVYLMASIFGLASAFYSGTADAWVIDWLKSIKRKDLISSFYIRDLSINTGAFAIGAFLSGLVVQYLSFDAIWYLQAFGWTLSFFVLLGQRDSSLHKSARIISKIHQSFTLSKHGFRYSKDHPVIIRLILGIAFFSMAVEVAALGIPLLLVTQGFDIAYLGYLTSLIAVLGALFPFVTPKLLGFVRHEKIYLSLYALSLGIGFALTGFLGIAFFTAIMYCFMFMRMSIQTPILEPYFHTFIPSASRATIASVRNMMVALAIVITNIIAGPISDQFGLTILMGTCLVFAVPAALCFLSIKDSHEIKKYL